MLLNLLSSLFFSNKIYMAASLNKHYIAGSRAIFIVITATLLDDYAYYVFDNNYSLSNFSSIFYFSEFCISVLGLSILGRILGGSPKQLSFKGVFKGFSYTLSPVIFGSIWLIIISSLTNLNVSHHDQVQIGAYLAITVWMWICQFLFVMTYFDKISTIKKLIMFAINILIYLGMDKFKKFFYLFLSGSQ